MGTKHFKLLFINFNRFRYAVWYLAMNASMFLHILNIFTTGQFLARILRTKHCEAYQAIRDTWTAVLAESCFFGWLPVTLRDFANCCVFCYMLIWIQPVYTLYASIPLEPQEYTIGIPKNKIFRTLADEF